MKTSASDEILSKKETKSDSQELFVSKNEKVYLNEADVFVSNRRVILHGTTYVTANITSVSKRITPPNVGFAAIVLLIGIVFLFGAIVGISNLAVEMAIPFSLVGLFCIIIGVKSYRSEKASYHVVVSLAGIERVCLTRQDQATIDRVNNAITSAISER